MKLATRLAKIQHVGVMSLHGFKLQAGLLQSRTC